MTTEGSTTTGHSRRVGRQLPSRLERLLSRGGPDFRRLAVTNGLSGAGDTLVALALAGTLFFSVPSGQARANVAAYLLLTLAPFAVLAPALTMVLARFPATYRHGLVASCGLRAAAAAVMIAGLDTLWLYPLALVLLITSRLFTISRSSLLPVALTEPTSLVDANARLAQVGVAGGALAVPAGILTGLSADWGTLLLATAVFVAAALVAAELPTPPRRTESRTRPSRRQARTNEQQAGNPHHPWPAQPSPGSLLRRLSLTRPVRLAQLATAGVRLLNGFLLLLLAFALREIEAGLLDFGALLGAAGGGYLVAAIVSPWLEHRLREEPMVIAALAVEAAAAFVAAQIFGVPAAAALAGAAGLAWGAAKLAFDGLLQAATDPQQRGLAFTRSETLFALAWVIGAIIPVAVALPARLGLSVAGIAALSAQVIYASSLLAPPARS